jgi:hypothetical protein
LLICPLGAGASRQLGREGGLSGRSEHPQLMLWVAWLVIMADHKIADDEALLIRHLVRLARDQHQVVDRRLAHLVDIDPTEVWRRLTPSQGI